MTENPSINYYGIKEAEFIGTEVRLVKNNLYFF